MEKSLLQRAAHFSSARPLVAGTLSGDRPLSPQLSAARAARVDILEIRLDTFAFLYQDQARVLSSSQALLRRARRAAGCPVLLTLRASSECGRTLPSSRRWSDDQRAALVGSLLSHVQAVDIEVRRPRFAAAIAPRARRRGVATIFSFHDFKTAGRLAEIEKCRQRAAAMRADFFKVAVTPRSEADLDKLLWWGASLRRPRPILIGMGRAGLASRFAAFSFGSALTFGHLGRAAAPGQAPAHELARVTRALYAPAGAGR